MTTIENIVAKPCPYTHLEGPLIGSRCGTKTHRYRCILHVGKKWPEKSFLCSRVITKGVRKDQPCLKSTKFQDGICSSCRKIKK
jgi:hypothetical protein